jgi:flavin reductase (DIM6/NTAB) family NADH-FMN oxidoreductase RutF
MVAPTKIEIADFRRACGRFATGVAVVTACQGGQTVGMTINSFSSVSLEPPLVLWSLRNTARSRHVFEAAANFAISILSSEQARLARCFAAGSLDGFAAVETVASPLGLPLIPGAIAHMECATYDIRNGGDHRIIIGSVNSLAVHDGAPLLFYGGQLLSDTKNLEEPVKS